jgi:hypothetical protein
MERLHYLLPLVTFALLEVFHYPLYAFQIVQGNHDLLARL